MEILSLALRLFGDTVAVGRDTMLFSSLITLGAVAFIGWRLAGPIAAPLALFSTFFPEMLFRGGGTIQAEMPSLTLALLAVTALLCARGERPWGWIAASGACFALAMLCKLLVAPMLVPLLFPLVYGCDLQTADWGRLLPRRRDLFPGLVLRFLVFGLAGMIVGLVLLLPYDPAAVYDQVVRFHGEAKKVFKPDWQRNLTSLYWFSRGELGLVCVAVVGVAVLFWKRPVAATWLCLWTISSALFLLDHAPPFERHLVLLVPPLALAASGVALALPILWQRPSRRLLVLVCVLPSVSLALDEGRGGLWRRLEWSLQRNLDGLPRGIPREDREVLALIERHTGRGDYVVSDMPMQVFLAGRKMAPWLCDTSYVRIKSGYLTDGQAIAASEGARMIILWGARLDLLPEYARWVQSNFRLVKEYQTLWGFSRRVYLRPDGMPGRSGIR